MTEEINKTYTSNSLYNDSTGVIAFAEQLKQELINWANYQHVTEELGQNRPDLQNELNNLFLSVYERFLTFLNDADASEEAINTWKEIENFLADYADDKTLASIVAELNNKIESRLTVPLESTTGSSTTSTMTQKAITETIDASKTFTTGERVDNVGIDNEPTAGSNNLVKSGGVFNLITPVINVNVETLDTFYHKYVVYDTGGIATSSQTSLANMYFIQLSDNFPNKIRAYIGNNSYGTVAVIAFFSSLEHTQDSYIKSSSVPGERNVNEGIWYEASVPENAKLIVISNLSSIVEIPEIELYYQKYAEYSEFKEERNRSIQKDEELEQNIEQVKTDIFDKDVVPELEMGNIAMSASGWRYTNSTTRVRTKEGTSIHLNVGDRIYLTNHNEAKMYISWKTSENVYKNVGWILNGEFNVVEEGDYVILLAKYIEGETTVEELAQFLKVINYSKRTKELVFEKYVKDLSCFFYLLKEKMGLGITNETISINTNSYILYTKVKKNDRLLIVSRFLEPNIYITNLRYGFTNVEPAENVNITSNTNWTSILGGWNTLFSVEEDGFFCIAMPKSYFISYLDSISIYNVNSFITPNDLTGVLSDFITQEQASELFATKSDLVSKDLNTIYPVASSLTRYHHLFMDEIENNSTVIVPSQSIADVRVAAKLGFNMMELNNMKTSDNVWVCRHQVNGMFEGLVNNTSGEVEAVNVAETTYTSLKANYKYKSIVPQFKVPVATLDETLAEMRKYNIQPFIYLYDDSIIASVKKYFGNRFVAYRSGTRRPENLKGITAFVYSHADTVADVKAAIDGWGAPYMHGIASPNSFTDAELTELLAYAHSKGCSLGWAAGYSSEQANQHYRDLGLDFCSSGWDVPEFEYGNVIDIQGNSLNGFADFTLSSGASTDSDGVIVLAAGESISASAASKLLGKCLLDVTFKGSVKVTMGKHIVNSSFVESEIKERVFTSIMENEPLAFTITAESEAHIYSVDFKGSQVV